ncbi:hypothetical protein BJY04DRAFT_198683 [Aspergillus karnatakaensis]|uniref:uncharacterized protein n=1 Tax=Aspergillus karnatakaensis TaxID=1810916 RepID=UPI003CCCE843
MDRDVVEGNSTSDTSTRFHDLSESSALMDFSHMHMNDLGLTPSPGHQLQGDILQNEEQNCSSRTVSAGSRDAIEQTEFQTSLDAFDAQANDLFGDDENSYDPLFDSTLPELDFFFSRKRTSEESDLPPEKRQHLETPVETPSLTPDESSTGFFDDFDRLFARGLDPLVFPHDVLPQFEKDVPQFPPSPPVSLPVVSDSTKDRFGLDEHDIITSTTQEVLQINKSPEYASPYPVPGGHLGYFPSAPCLQVKRVALQEVEKDKQIAWLQNHVSELARERDSYKKSLARYTRLDGDGKSIAQLLEETATLRRVASRHQARIDGHRKDATEWRNRLHALSTIYNNLLYEIQVEKRVPTIDSAPHGYQPRRLSTSLQRQIAGNFVVNTTSIPAPPQASYQHTIVIPDAEDQPTVPTAHCQSSGQQHQPPGQPSQLTQQPKRNEQQVQFHGQFQRPEQPQKSRAVTIDLTEEDETPSCPAATESSTTSTSTLKTLRAKKYDWLKARNDTSRVPSPSPNINEDELALLVEANLSQT